MWTLFSLGHLTCSIVDKEIIMYLRNLSGHFPLFLGLLKIIGVSIILIFRKVSIISFDFMRIAFLLLFGQNILTASRLPYNAILPEILHPPQLPPFFILN